MGRVWVGGNYQSPSHIETFFTTLNLQINYPMPLKVTWRKYQDWTDEQILEKFRESGDLQQLGTLYERYMHLVYGVSLKYLEDREEARDAVTSIFEKLITELPRHEVDNFKSWLYVMTKNFCLMKIRADRTLSRRQEKYHSDQQDFMESYDEMHPVDEEDSLLNKKLQECISKLKDEQQRCIKLFYYEEKSYREISAQLKLDEKKVKSYIQNGKRNLKICIEGRNEKRA